MNQLQQLKDQVGDMKRNLDHFYLSQSTTLCRLQNSIGEQLFHDPPVQPETCNEVNLQALLSDSI